MEGGRLLPASCRLRARHPPPTSAGPFLPATPALSAARGPAPTRPQAASPIFRAALVQTSAIAPPFPLRPAPFRGWGYPSACACYPPPSPGGVRHLVSNAAHKRENKRSNDVTNKKYNAEFQILALANIHESTTNPRRTFDESKLTELADYVSGHIIGLMFRKRLCGRCGGKPHGWWRCAF
jgi:hypothetical protein